MEYLLKASLVTTIFYTCYKIFLQRDTFFQPNRWFLLVGLIASFTLPLVIIPVYIEFTPMPALENIVIADPLPTPQVTETPMSIWQYITISYILGLTFFLIRFCVQLISLFWLISKNKKYKQEGYTYVETTNNTPPFSFFKWMVYNPNQFNKEELQHIISHEKVHIKQHHTIDIILSQLNAIIFWFNPISWFYKKDLQQNLEFIADYNAQTNSNRKNYQKLLLKTSMPTHQLALTNNFYNSLIKKRIVMLQKSKSRKRNLFKHILVLPLIALFLYSFNTKDVYVPKAIETNNSSTFEANNTATKTVIITKESTDIQLKAFREQLVLNNITLVLSDVIRNNNNEIIKLTAKVTNDKGSGGATWANGNTPIPNIEVGENENGSVIARTISNDVSTNKTTIKNINESQNTDKIKIIFDKDLTDLGLKQIKEKLKKSNIVFTYSNLNRNTKGEISKISTKFEHEGGHSIYNAVNNPIKPFYFSKSRTSFGVSAVENTIKKVKQDIPPFSVTISKDLTDADFNKIIKQGKEKGVTLKFSKIKRNAKNEIIAIHAEFKNEHGAGTWTFNSDKPIKPFAYTQDNSNFGFGSPNKIHVIGYDKIRNTTSIGGANGITNTIKVIGYKNSQNGNLPIYVVDGKEIANDDIDDIDSDKINSVYILKGEQAIEEYGDKGKDGVVVVTTKAKSSTPVTFKLNDGSLFIVDGKEVNKNVFKSLKPNQIDDINILKGKLAINKYGDKGKNDVIEITTKNLTIGYPYDSSNQTGTLTISGNVSTANGKGLPGTTIIVKGSTKGTTANLDGHYKIKVSEGDKLVFSFPGMASKEVVVKNEKQINIVLNEGESVIEEGSSVLKSSNRNTIIKATKALTTEKPLIIIDGKKVKNKSFEDLDPNNIESVTILKDKSVIKKYGKKAKDGVLLITTKNKK